MAHGTTFAAIGDILLTAPEPQNVSLPFLGTQKAIRGPSGHIAGITQKAVLIGAKTLVLWAGDLSEALRALRRIEAISDEGAHLIDFEALVEDLDWSALAPGTVSLIYHFANDGVIETRWFNAVWDEERRIVAAGSGAPHFLTELSIGSVDQLAVSGGETPMSLVDFLGRTGLAIMKQMGGRETIDRHYGGWFELVGCDGYTFTKASICCKAWLEVDGEFLADMPLFFSGYNGSSLEVVELRQNQSGLLRPETYRVDSPLHPPITAPVNLLELCVDWDFEFHIFIKQGGNGTGILLRSAPPVGERIRCSFPSGNPTVVIPDTVTAEIRAAIELREQRPGLRERLP